MKALLLALLLLPIGGCATWRNIEHAWFDKPRVEPRSSQATTDPVAQAFFELGLLAAGIAFPKHVTASSTGP
jgi:hypothetical protein